MWFNRIKIMFRLVYISGPFALLGFCVSPSVGERNLQLANLKQDMELVSRELAGLRTNGRREMRNFVFQSSNFRRQNPHPTS